MDVGGRLAVFAEQVGRYFSEAARNLIAHLDPRLACVLDDQRLTAAPFLYPLLAISSRRSDVPNNDRLPSESRRSASNVRYA